VSIPQQERRYLDYERNIDSATQDCVLANWGQCSSCDCPMFPVEMRAFEYRGGIFFEGACPQWRKLDIQAYETVVD
jgi:hypothetical protein